MNNEIRPPAWFSLAVAAAVAAGFFSLWLTDFAVVRSDWCSGVETACLREWIGALSGWAAAAAAIATLSILWRQLGEMRRQADFLNGFAEPEITLANSPTGVLDLRLTIRNWNRHDIEVFQILSHPNSDGDLHNLREVDNSGGVIEGYENDFKEWVPPEIRLVVPGWTNRSESPHVRWVDLQVIRKRERAAEFGRQPAGFLVSIRFYDAQHSRRQYEAWMPDTFLF